MTCQDCVHYEVCDALEKNGISKIYPSLCGYFKDKSKFIELPCEVGDNVYHITKCKNFGKVLDGTMYDMSGGFGTATGYYCPYELYKNCPFPLDNDKDFECDDHKNKLQIFDDVVTGIVIDDMQEFVMLKYSGNVYFSEFGKTVFLIKEEAEQALKEREGK